MQVADPSRLLRIPEEVHQPWQARQTCSFPNVTMSGSLAPRKMIETAATFRNDPRVIHNGRQRFYGGRDYQRRRS